MYKKHCFKYNINVVCGVLIEYLHIFTLMNCVKKLWPNLVTMEYPKITPSWRVLDDVLHRYAMFYFNISSHQVTPVYCVCTMYWSQGNKINKLMTFVWMHTMSQSQGNEMKKKLDDLSPKLYYIACLSSVIQWYIIEIWIECNINILKSSS